MGTLIVYRNGTGDLEARLKAAVRAFYQARRRLPVAIVVNRTELAAAVGAVKALDLRMPITSSGGCLVPEIWLGVGKSDE